MHDVVINGGTMRKRKKGPSKEFRGKFGYNAAFGRGGNSVGRRAAACRNGRPWRASGNGRSLGGGETAVSRS
jgi:hypothetical protein